MLPGRGVKADINGASVLAGNIKMLEESNILIEKRIINEAQEFLSKGSTVIYIAVDAL